MFANKKTIKKKIKNFKIQKYYSLTLIVSFLKRIFLIFHIFVKLYQHNPTKKY